MLQVHHNRNKFKATGGCILHLAMTFIGILDGISDVKRGLARLQPLELKRRERHMTAELVEDCMNISLEVPTTIEALVTRTPAPMIRRAASGQPLVDKAPLLHLVWRPQKLILRSMKKYAMFYGARRLASRSLVVQSIKERMKQVPRQ